MHETDLKWITSELAQLACFGRVAVTGRNRFTLIDPFVLPGAGCDFELRGTRRRRAGDERIEREVSFPVVKVLQSKKGLLIVQTPWEVLALRPALWGREER